MFRQLPNSAKPTSPQDGQMWYEQSSGDHWAFLDSGWKKISFSNFCDDDTEDEVDMVIRKMRHAAPELADMIAKYSLVADAVDQLEVALKLCQNLDSDDQT